LDVPTIVALAAAALAVPPAVVAIQEYRRRADIRPSVELRDGIKLAIVNVGSAAVNNRDIEVVLCDA
jgi:pilus assembly protein TadC